MSPQPGIILRLIRLETGVGFEFQDNRPASAIQRKQVEALAAGSPVQRAKNDTGLPDQLKSGIENLSGCSMDDVKVHYNSYKPAQLNAHAYAQGADIHIASGQERHLPHEAWHVVQQKKGRVQPTMQMKGKVNINDDKGLEKEADVMGAKAAQLKKEPRPQQGEIDRALGAKTSGYGVPFQMQKWSTNPIDGEETKVDWITGNLGGNTVGVEMQAFPLKRPDHLQGGPPKSGVQSKLMNMLPTDPHLQNSDKYIRGHLLNDNLGGPGDDFNLFPITANANKEHEQVIESKVKKWVNDDKQWVKYNVKVNNVNDKLKHGVVNSEFSCRASILDPHNNGKEINTIAATINSEHKVTHSTDKTFAGGSGMQALLGPQALLHKALLSTSKKENVVLDPETIEHLEYLFSLPEAAKALKKLLMEYEGIGQGTVSALNQFTPATADDAKDNEQWQYRCAQVVAREKGGCMQVKKKKKKQVK